MSVTVKSSYHGEHKTRGKIQLRIYCIGLLVYGYLSSHAHSHTQVASFMNYFSCQLSQILWEGAARVSFRAKRIVVYLVMCRIELACSLNYGVCCFDPGGWCYVMWRQFIVFSGHKLLTYGEGETVRRRWRIKEVEQRRRNSLLVYSHPGLAVKMIVHLDRS